MQQSLEEIKSQIKSRPNLPLMMMSPKKNDEEPSIEAQPTLSTKRSDIARHMNPKMSPSFKMHPVTTSTGFWLTNKPQPDSSKKLKLRLSSTAIENRYRSVGNKSALITRRSEKYSNCSKQLNCIERNNKPEQLTTSFE